MKFKIGKKIIYSAAGICLLVFLFVILVNLKVASMGNELIVKNINGLSEAQAVIALGAKVYSLENLSDTFKDRLDTALDIYNQGKAKKILISGDHGRKEYDEVNAGKDYLLKKGARAEDIFLDYAGFDTYDSLYRAGYIFKIDSIIIPTQKMNLPRAVYLGDGLGLKTQGIAADRHIYVNSLEQFFRERLANVKAFLNIVLKSKPKFLGPEININGDSRKSWD